MNLVTQRFTRLLEHSVTASWKIVQQAGVKILYQLLRRLLRVEHVANYSIHSQVQCMHQENLHVCQVTDQLPVQHAKFALRVIQVFNLAIVGENNALYLINSKI